MMRKTFYVRNEGKTAFFEFPIITLLTGVLLLFSCKEEKGRSEIPVLKLTEVLEGNKTIELSADIASVKTVQLETNDDILIGTIRKVVFSQSHIIVQHDSQCSVFDLKGNFLRKISNRGQGPREYNSIINISLTGDTIRIFDTKKILSFNLRGEFISSYELPGRIDLITTFENIYIGYRVNRSGSENTRLLFFDNEGRLFDSIPYMKQYENLSDLIVVLYSSEVFMYQYDNTIRLKELANDTLFSISADKILTPLYIMDLGKYAPKEEERFQLYSAQQSLFEGKKLLNLILETNSHLVLNVGLKPNRYILYDKETGALENVAFRYNDEEKSRFGKDFFNPKFVSEDKRTLISFELSADIDNDDNPVLVLVTFKN